MIHRIVVGVDGSEGGEDALELARRLAGTRADVVAVCVSPTILGSPRTPGAADSWRVAQPRERRATRQAAARGVRSEIILAPTVAGGLQTSALRHDADLLVIGSSRRGAVGRILEGDDTRGALREAPCPVAIAPRDLALTEGRVAEIGVGWNGGEESEAAVAFACDLARDVGAHVHALTVVGTLGWPGDAGPPVVADVDPEKAGPLPEGVHATRATGLASDELARFAAEVDVLVVGSRRRGPIARVVVGSTAEAVVRRSVRPVIVVPRPVRRWDAAATSARHAADDITAAR